MAVPLTLAALTGCVRYQAQPLRPEATAQAWASRSLNDEGLHQFMNRALRQPVASWPLHSWTLDDLTLAAIYEQPALAVARAQWAVAQAGQVTAAQRPNPSLSASGTYDTTTAPPWIPAVSFDVPIETAGKRGDRIRQAAANTEAARWDWVGQVWQTRANVRSAFFDVHDSAQRVHLLQNLADAETRWVHSLEQQASAGEISVADVTPGRVALQKARVDLLQATQHLDEARASLASAIGVPVAALHDVSLDFRNADRMPAPPSDAEVRKEAVLHRSDVLGALASYAASEAALQAEIANQYPDVHLGPGYELDQTDNKWTLGVTIPLPLLNRNEGPIAEAKARRALAAAQFVAIQARALEEASLALSSYRNALAQLRASSSALAQMSHQLASARQLAAAGETDQPSVLSAQIDYDTAAAFRLDAAIQARQALGRLELATQSPRLLAPDTLRQAEQLEANPSSPSHEP